jgi:hypothetical protein
VLSDLIKKQKKNIFVQFVANRINGGHGVSDWWSTCLS